LARTREAAAIGRNGNRRDGTQILEGEKKKWQRQERGTEQPSKADLFAKQRKRKSEKQQRDFAPPTKGEEKGKKPEIQDLK